MEQIMYNECLIEIISLFINEILLNVLNHY